MLESQTVMKLWVLVSSNDSEILAKYVRKLTMGLIVWKNRLELVIRTNNRCNRNDIMREVKAYRFKVGNYSVRFQRREQLWVESFFIFISKYFKLL